MFHKEIFSKEQIELLDLVKVFSRNFYLVGGTAIALQLGHRRSIDFDLFTEKALRPKLLLEKIQKDKAKIQKVFVRTGTELTLVINSVKMTFYNFPFRMPVQIKFEKYISIPPLLDLAAMKAFALGGRGKWKDYVDLYFILRFHFSLSQIENRTREIFGELFNRKLFREQLAYYEDIDDSEEIDFIGEEVAKQVVKEFLTNVATTPF